MSPPYFWLLAAIVLSTLASVGGLKLHERWEQRQDLAREARDAERQAAHERRAVEREEKAVARHERISIQLAANAKVFMAAVDQRTRLELRTIWLEAAIENHGDHLIELGREPGEVHRTPPPRR
jgi:hypothetical protein